jgi:hypothetical protein
MLTSIPPHKLSNRAVFNAAAHHSQILLRSRRKRNLVERCKAIFTAEDAEVAEQRD